MDRVYVIRHKWHQEGLSIRQIARDLGVSRDTVRKYIGDADEARQKAPSKRARPVLEDVRGGSTRSSGSGASAPPTSSASPGRWCIANFARRGMRWAARRCAPTWRSGAANGRKCLCR